MLEKSAERILRRMDRMGFAGAGEALREIERQQAQIALLKASDNDLTTAYMVGFHKRDDEVAALKSEIERLRANERGWLAANGPGGWIDDLRQEIEQLRGFARSVLRVWPDGDLDGGDLQDAAVEAGLLVQRQVTEIPCGHGCRCVDYYDDDDFKAGRHVCYERNRDVLGE